MMLDVIVDIDVFMMGILDAKPVRKDKQGV